MKLSLEAQDTLERNLSRALSIVNLTGLASTSGDFSSRESEYLTLLETAEEGIAESIKVLNKTDKD